VKESRVVLIGVVGSFRFFLVAVWLQHVDSVQRRWRDLKVAEEQLDSWQQKLTAAVDDDRKSALRDEHRAWLERRNAECHLRPPERTGDFWMEAIAWHGNKAACLIRSTNQRVGELRTRLKTAMALHIGSSTG
jgi:uncharacterized protein YecT (DUF1311 family)